MASAAATCSHIPRTPPTDRTIPVAYPAAAARANAVRLYEQGWSVARIGAWLGVDGGTAWSALRARGVRMRAARGRDR